MPGISSADSASSPPLLCATSSTGDGVSAITPASFAALRATGAAVGSGTAAASTPIRHSQASWRDM